MHQQSFYNPNTTSNGIAGGHSGGIHHHHHNDALGSAGTLGGAMQDQNSPGPQGTLHGGHHIQNHMMLIDSTTPMFTSEFTIMPAPTLMMGGLETTLGLPNNLINEWNPMQ